MGKSKVIINTGVYLEKNLMDIYNNSLTLAQTKTTRFSLEFTLHNKLRCYIDGEVTDNINIDELNDDEKKFLTDAKKIREAEAKYFNFTRPYIKLFFDHLIINYEDFSITLNPIITHYDSGILIFSYQIDFDNISSKDFINTICKMNEQKIVSVDIPPSLIYNQKKNVYMNVADDVFQTIDDVTEFLIVHYGFTLNQTINYKRTTYYVDEEELSDDDVIKLLYSFSGKTKNIEIGKDFRLCNDYIHYFNELNTVIIGRNCTENYTNIQIQEEFFIKEYVLNTEIFKCITQNSFNRTQLQKIKQDFMLEDSYNIFSSYTEFNDIILHFHKITNRDYILKNILAITNDKIKNYEIEFQNNVTLITLLLTSVPITQFILFPLYNLINKYLNFNFNKNLLSIIFYITSLIIVYIIYKLLKKDMKY